MHIVGVGLSNIDLVVYVGDDFLKKHGFEKGQAHKLCKSSFSEFMAQLPDFSVMAGGCAGNTLCGLADQGIQTTFFGKVGAGDYAALYRKSFAEHNVHFPTDPDPDRPSSKCVVMVTPDGERTFAYMRGASWKLSADDLDFDLIATADLVYTEIYAMAFGMDTGLWPELVNYMRHANLKMAMKTVDKEYADLYRTALFGLAEEGILRLLIGNEDNLCALARRDTIDEALQYFSQWRCATLLTDGINGAYYQENGQVIHFSDYQMKAPKNTSGAGDQFAAGFLPGWLDGGNIRAALANGEAKALEVIMKDNPRR